MALERLFFAHFLTLFSNFIKLIFRVMGQVSSVGKVLGFYYLVLIVQVASIDTKPTSIFIGVSGDGKSTIVGNLCDVNLLTGDGAERTTTEAEIVDCVDQVRIDTVGLLDVRSDDTENAYFRGLDGLLNFMLHKEVGHIYLVSMSTHRKDYGRILEQVEVIKSLVNPLIPWTTVINCYEGICPSSKGGYSDFHSHLNKLTDDVIEVASPHEIPISKRLFPAPKVNYEIGLTSDFHEKIALDNIKTLRDNMTKLARGKCDEVKQLLETNSKFECPLEQCIAVNCDTLAQCPSASCPDYPCASRDSCNFHRRESYNCGLFHTCHRDIHWTDGNCLRLISECEAARSEHCAKHAAKVENCAKSRQSDCAELATLHQKCVLNRDSNCTELHRGHIATRKAVIDKHRDMYDQCVVKFGYQSLNFDSI